MRLVILSLLGVQETMNRQGLGKKKANDKKLSCGVGRTSGELGKCLSE